MLIEFIVLSIELSYNDFIINYILYSSFNVIFF